MTRPLQTFRRGIAVVFSLALLGALVPALLTPAHAAVAAVDFHQCANQPAAPHECEWIAGNVNPTKARYAENMSVPQRLMLTAVTPTVDAKHTLVFTTQWTKSGQHAFDWLTSYAQAEASAAYYGVPFTDLAPCVDVSNEPACAALRAGAYHDVAVPDDSYVSHDGGTQSRIDAYETQFGNRTIRLYGTGVSVDGLTLAHPAGSDTGDTQVTWTLRWTGNAPAVLLEMAAHVATSSGAAGWGAGTGAAGISGSPYHVSLASLDGSPLGSQDNQMSAGVIVAPGQLRVTKSLSPADDPGLFDLQVDGTTRASAVGHGGTTGLVQVLPGEHTVGEVAATGTSLASYDSTVTCADGEPTAGTSATITVAEGATVECTVANTRRREPTGTLEVVKDLAPGDDPGRFDLLIDGGTQASSVGDGGTTGPVTVSADSHTFGEAAASGTSLDDYDVAVGCTDGEGAVSATATEGAWSVDVGADAAVVCTITNTRKVVVPPPGSLRIDKVAIGHVSDAATFTFDVDCGEAFTASDVVVVTAASGLGSSTVLGPIAAGADCTVTEDPAAGWRNDSGTPTVGIVSGETATAAFQNTELFTDFGLVKSVDVDGDGPDDDGALVLPGAELAYTLAYANTGTESVELTITDALPAGAEFVSVADGGSFADGVATWTVEVAAGGTGAVHWVVRALEPAAAGTVIDNVATAGDEDQVTRSNHVVNPVAFGDLSLAKSVSPAGRVEYGATLDYTLTAAATGNRDQHGVVVTDVVPAGTDYVAGSARCLVVACTTGYDAASRTVTWQVGDLVAGATRQVAFSVVVTRPATGATVPLPARTIVNVGAVASVERPSTPSNEVQTPVTAVLGVKVVAPETPDTPEGQLPFSGSPLELGPLSLVALVLVGSGTVLVRVRRRPGTR